MLNKDEIWYVLCRLLHSICLFHTDQFTAQCTASCNCTLYINTHVVCCFPSSPLYSPIVKLFCTALVYTCVMFFFFGGGIGQLFHICTVLYSRKGTLECMLMYPTIYSVVHLRREPWSVCWCFLLFTVYCI